MNFDISFQSERPDWNHWTRMGSVTLRDAILLTLDVCPHWYEYYIANRVYMLDSGACSSSLSEGEDYSTYKVFDYIEKEYSIRLQVVQSWAFNQNWFIDKKDFTQKEINGKVLVDLKNFFLAAFNQMKFSNEYDDIPSNLYVAVGLKDDSGLKHLSLIPSTQSNWKLKPKSELKRCGGYRIPLYETVKELLEENPSQKPSPRLVKDKWKKNKPDDIYEVLTDEFKYFNNSGEVETATWTSLGKTINNLRISNNAE